LQLTNYNRLLSFLPFVVLTFFVYLIDFNGLYGQDSYEYARYSLVWKDFILGGTKPSDYFWPLLYPFLGSIISILIPNPYSLQLLSLISFLFSALLIEKIIIKIYCASGDQAKQYVFLFFSLSPFILRASTVVMSDMLCLLFILLSTYFFILIQENFLNKYLYLYVISFTASIMTRYAAFIILLPTAFHLFYSNYSKIRFKNILVILLIIFTLISPHLYIRSNNSLNFIQHQWILNWNPLNFFKNAFNTVDGNYKYIFPNIIYGFCSLVHPGFIFLGIIFLLFFRKNILQSQEVKILIVAVFIYAIFISGIPFQNLRFLLLSFPAIILIFYPSYIKITDKLKKYNTFLFISIIIIQLLFFYRVFKPFYIYNKTEKTISNSLLKYPSRAIYTLELDPALNYYGLKSEIVNLFTNRLSEVKQDSYLLFNEKKFTKEFKNENPMINYEYIKSHKQLVKLEEYPEGWVLYANQ
jgi:hypothetical protein